jgi:phytol kinase
MSQSIIDSFKYLFIDNFPSLKLILWLLPSSFIFGLFILFFAGILKKDFKVRTGLTRKLFHFVVFGSAGIIQFFIGLPATLVFGGGISLVVLYALLKGDEHILYEALARESDEPTRARYVIMPYFATLFGGLTVNLLFIPLHSLSGYLVTGLADAIGEPVGVKWGKHKYKVPSLSGFVSYRSIEGSLAVFLSVFFIFLFISILSSVVFTTLLFTMILLSSAVVTLVEALSPHGWDNFTTMIVGSLLSFWIF